ncbi:MAG: hypothetical protein KDK62_01045 [Chlamydiia bacterium]|nr:hypothetical protein [Chlamydiia bacterium]
MTSTLSLDLSLRNIYGTAGMESVRKMDQAVRKRGLGLDFDLGSKRFTVLYSSGMSKDTVQLIFSEYKYCVWKPLVIDETDRLGNFQVKMIWKPLVIDETDRLGNFQVKMKSICDDANYFVRHQDKFNNLQPTCTLV